MQLIYYIPLQLTSFTVKCMADISIYNIFKINCSVCALNCRRTHYCCDLCSDCEMWTHLNSQMCEDFICFLSTSVISTILQSKKRKPLSVLPLPGGRLNKLRCGDFYDLLLNLSCYTVLCYGYMCQSYKSFQFLIKEHLTLWINF